MFSYFNAGTRVSRKRARPANDSHFLDGFTTQFNRNNLFFQWDNRHQVISESIYVSTLDFRRRIKRCLLLLKQKAPEYYGLFCLFNIKIRAIDEFGTYANFINNTIDLYGLLEEESDAGIASELIHETIHFWQQESGVPHFGTVACNWKDGNSQACELEAIKHQLNVLRLIGGTDKEIKYVEKQRGTHGGFIRYQP